MAINVALTHKTRYKYDRRISLGPQVIRLRPAPHCRTPILAYSLKIEPKQHFLNWQQDPQSNYLARVVVPEPTTEFSVEVDLVAEMGVFNPFDFFLEPSAETYPFTYDAALARELKPYFETHPVGPLLTNFIAQIPREPMRTIDFLVAANQRVKDEVGYVIRLEPGIQTCEETLQFGTGSCRDSAWLLVEVLRHMGLAARFVSGYLIQLVADVKPLEGPAGASTDFTDLHAWGEVYLPGAGWIGFDPTSGLLANEGHIPLACSPDASSAAPITGLVDPCNTEFSYEMKVERILESPRVTKPYTEEQWRDIKALGHFVDSKLRTGGVRLTMGGEPTFVSLDDPDGAEWTQEAVGPMKRKLAMVLLKKLRDFFAPKALLHYGQGKWYPGEILPRWAFGCYWRKDGVALWENAELIAEDEKDYGYTIAEARQFLEALTRRLQVGFSHAMPAYEDRFYYLWRERRLPVNVDPLDSKLANPTDRMAMARVFEEGLDEQVGYVLPLRRIATRGGKPRWTSQPWFLRTEQIFLIPGDSPMGYRLPLESLPWTKPEDVLYSFDADPFAQRDVLPARPARRPDLFNGPAAVDAPQPEADRGKPPEKGESSPWIARPALCIQPRDGKLYIFLPAVEHVPDYLDLIAAIEDTAEHLQMPVVMEGYTPPADPRLREMKITPDPGVMEVNIHPADSWDDLVRNVEAVYRLARESRLTTEKFLLDGQHSGTGGGNHIVVGGPTAAESPFLRRPDLLRSLVGYWQNHPALSYLFSGMFIGPTSQHPRVDEARTDALYELEIAFSQIPDSSKQTTISPWVVDRVFRNLLVDATGNTHRAEFCIDKLFPPESSERRLGLVELRGFEMPPHAHMSLAQQLVVRALIAHFWQNPYKRKLVWWGTTLQDRFMLPHFVQADWEDVLTELREAGFAFQNEWFAAHLEFRFPFIGAVTRRGVGLELRRALEAWPVLGEESQGGATVRNVDSSVERLQVKATGMSDARYTVLCNRRPVPLHATGGEGEFVAGVRYRAWQPAACLHPNIPVHTPLVFDIVDTWSGRSIGGCNYHVTHPGGRAHEKFPVNSFEAESRRLARFSESGHTPGKMAMPPEEPNAAFPMTLDLRRKPCN